MQRGRGSRACSLRLHVDLDHAVDHSSDVYRHRLRRGQGLRLTSLQAERAAVLPALDLLGVAEHLALAQRHVGVTACVAYRVDVVTDPHYCDGTSVDLEP